jgi:hypothetical protein
MAELRRTKCCCHQVKKMSQSSSSSVGKYCSFVLHPVAACSASLPLMASYYVDEGARQTQRGRVEVVFPSAAAAAEAGEEESGAGHASAHVIYVPSSCGSVNVEDFDSIVAKALEELPPELVALAKDPKRHAKSKDPGWKYGFWPYEGKRDMLQCIFCKKVVPAGIKRFKKHLVGGYGDIEKCPKAIVVVRKEMSDYLKKNVRIQAPPPPGRTGREGEAENECEIKEVPTTAVPSSGTKVKDAKRKAKAQQASISSYISSGKTQSHKFSKSVSSMLCKTPEEVVQERQFKEFSTNNGALHQEIKGSKADY